MEKSSLTQAFEVLSDRDGHFNKIAERQYPSRIIWGQVLLIFFFTFFYGCIMGSYNSVPQALVTGIKLWVLFFLTLIICFPSFYIIQLILGSKVSIKQLTILILSGFVMTTTILVAFAPIVLFFQLSGGEYQFLQLLHVGIFIFAGFFGMRVVLEALKNAFEQQGIYPKIGVNVFRIWIVIFAFVGMQLSWNLRPFLGSREMPFELFRASSQGNFYSTVFRAIGHLLDGNQEAKKPKSEAVNPPRDSVSIIRDSIMETSE